MIVVLIMSFMRELQVLSGRCIVSYYVYFVNGDIEVQRGVVFVYDYVQSELELGFKLGSFRLECMFLIIIFCYFVFQG